MVKYGYEDLDNRQGVPYKLLINRIQETPYHWHQELEILLVVEGSVTVTVEGQQNIMGEDDIIIINPYNLHSTILDYTSSTVVLGVQISPAYFDHFLNNFSKRHYLCKSFLHSKSFDIKADPIRGAIARMFLQFTMNREGYQLCNLSIVNLLCTYLYHSIPWEESQAAQIKLGSEDRTRIHEMLTYIKEHAETNITLEELANQYHVNRYYLSHFFKEKVGMGFKNYITNVRLDNAAEELLSTDHTITYVAGECGFSNQTSFFNQFRRRYGCLPSEFRKVCSKQEHTERDGTEMEKKLYEKLTEYAGREYASLNTLLPVNEKVHSFVSLMHRNG